jgi:hypothetical protein
MRTNDRLMSKPVIKLDREIAGSRRHFEHPGARRQVLGDPPAAGFEVLGKLCGILRVPGRRHRKDNGDDRCRLPYRGDSATDGDNYVDLQTDKLGRDFGVTLGAALRPAILDCDVTVLDPAQFAQVRDKRWGNRPVHRT